jgi:hypothetical protein
MWKHHVFYESRPCSVIVTLRGSTLQDTRGSFDYCPDKIVPQSNLSYCKKFSLFTIWSEENKDTTTTVASDQDLSIQQKQINKIVEEHPRYSYCTYRGASTLPSQAKL